MNFKKLVFLLGMVVLSFSFVNAQTAKYVGAAKCKMCHNKAEKGAQFSEWQAGPHANALKVLKGDELKNPIKKQVF
jgi:hypothetical protein